MSKLGVISQERLKIEVKLLLSANRKSYMPRRLAQQQMTLSDPEYLFHALLHVHHAKRGRGTNISTAVCYGSLLPSMWQRLVEFCDLNCMCEAQ